MDYWYVIVVVLFVIVAALLIRRQISGAIVERLPILPGEAVLLEERGPKVYHKIREASGGHSLTYRVTVVLTDRRILVATGGPEGKYKYLLKMILDYRTEAPQVSDTGYGAYYRKFQLEKGYLWFDRIHGGFPPHNLAEIPQHWGQASYALTGTISRGYGSERRARLPQQMSWFSRRVVAVSDA